MNDEPGAAPEPHEPTPGRSRYEDFDLADLQAGPQGAARPTGRRTPLLTVAAIVLAVSGLMPILVVIGFHPGGVVIGVLSARHSAVNGLVAIGLTGYVIYACAVSGPSFRRG